MLLFSGPEDRPDRLAAFLRGYGCVVDEYDNLNDSRAQDLTDDTVWGPIEERLQRGMYAAVFASPPCKTYSTARRIRPGPPVLRTTQYPLGIPRNKAKEFGLSDEHFVEIQTDNLLAARAAEACRLQHDTGGAVGVEQPAKMDEDHATMFERDDFAALRRHCSFEMVEVDQCMYGAETRKPTTLLCYGINFQPVAASCNHPVDWQWYKPVVGKGKWIRASHPPIAGCKADDGRWATAPKAQYPTEFNKELAKHISDAAWRVFEFRAEHGAPVSAEKLVVPPAASMEAPESRAAPRTTSPQAATPRQACSSGGQQQHQHPTGTSVLE